MPPIATRLIRLFAIAAIVAVVVAGCGAPTFDPASPCTEDGRMAGAYPALEQSLPREYDGRPPDSLDSGRNCEPAALSTLATHGIDEIRFAGAIWDQGSGAAVSFAVLEAGGLTSEWVAEFYEVGARSGRNVEEVTVKDVDLGETSGTRIDALNGESFQTVVVAPGERNQVRVVIIANPIRQIETRAAHENVVRRALGVEFEGFSGN